MSQLAMRKVDRTPHVEQLDDRLLLLGQKTVHRVAARSPVNQAALGPAGLPAVGPDPVQLDFPRNTASSTAWSITTAPRRSTSAWSLATSDASWADTLACPGRDACNAAIAPSLAIWRSRAMTVRSTPASAAACAWVTCPVSIRTHKSYFCSAVRNRFGLLVTDTVVVLHGEGQQTSQMWSEDPRILSREVRCKARAVGPRIGTW
jgi:hypothetical protein